MTVELQQIPGEQAGEVRLLPEGLLKEVRS